MGNRFVCDKCGKESEINSRNRFEVTVTGKKFGDKQTKDIGHFDIDETSQFCYECGDEFLQELNDFVAKRKPLRGEGA